MLIYGLISGVKSHNRPFTDKNSLTSRRMMGYLYIIIMSNVFSDSITVMSLYYKLQPFPSSKRRWGGGAVPIPIYKHNTLRVGTYVYLYRLQVLPQQQIYSPSQLLSNMHYYYTFRWQCNIRILYTKCMRVEFAYNLLLLLLLYSRGRCIITAERTADEKFNIILST